MSSSVPSAYSTVKTFAVVGGIATAAAGVALAPFTVSAGAAALVVGGGGIAAAAFAELSE